MEKQDGARIQRDPRAHDRARPRAHAVSQGWDDLGGSWGQTVGNRWPSIHR